MTACSIAFDQLKIGYRQIGVSRANLIGVNPHQEPIFSLTYLLLRALKALGFFIGLA